MQSFELVKVQARKGFRWETRLQSWCYVSSSHSMIMSKVLTWQILLTIENTKIRDEKLKIVFLWAVGCWIYVSRIKCMELSPFMCQNYRSTITWKRFESTMYSDLYNLKFSNCNLLPTARESYVFRNICQSFCPGGQTCPWWRPWMQADPPVDRPPSRQTPLMKTPWMQTPLEVGPQRWTPKRQTPSSDI